MAFDIGIGSCAALEGEHVLVKLDSAMVSKLVPGQPWRRSGTSMLRLDRAQCSVKRPPAVGSEVWLEVATLAKATPAWLDLAGDGEFKRIDLRSLLHDLDPQVAPKAPVKGRSR